ncbi:unnamed protein product [Owenia fusiformis]|uniref:Uncharacterized protein n=1 Tax=Owenia fusiformis TaxID=6347 RepID=A0A8J1UIN6_OWEFU|nr:unnamed protein product [Owenia fusiformis]
MLAKIAIFGGMAASFGALYFVNGIQQKFRGTDYYREGTSLLRKYKPAVEALGEPIRSTRLDLTDIEHNFADVCKAKLAVPVKGPKNKGTLFVFASRKDAGDDWQVDRLDLQIFTTQKRWQFFEHTASNDIAIDTTAETVIQDAKTLKLNSDSRERTSAKANESSIEEQNPDAKSIKDDKEHLVYIDKNESVTPNLSNKKMKINDVRWPPWNVETK